MKELVLFPDERLRVKSEPVQEFGSVLNRAIDDMTYTMRVLTPNGIGITAVQCGIHQRMAILDISFQQKRKIKPLVICNPVLLAEEGNALGNEGCLSFPGKFEKIKRAQIIRIKYQDEEGKDQYSFFHNLWARCVLHEIDHMDGILFIDRIKK